MPARILPRGETLLRHWRDEGMTFREIAERYGAASEGVVRNNLDRYCTRTGITWPRENRYGPNWQAGVRRAFEQQTLLSVGVRQVLLDYLKDNHLTQKQFAQEKGVNHSLMKCVIYRGGRIWPSTAFAILVACDEPISDALYAMIQEEERWRQGRRANVRTPTASSN